MKQNAKNGKSNKSGSKAKTSKKGGNKPALPQELLSLFETLGVDMRKTYSLGDPVKIFEISFENELGRDVLFTVEHRNEFAVKDSLIDLPVGLRTKNPNLRIVDVPAQAHFSFQEWFQLSSLALPGAWYYLGVPDEYKAAAETYAKIDPLGRVFGVQQADITE